MSTEPDHAARIQAHLDAWDRINAECEGAPIMGDIQALGPTNDGPNLTRTDLRAVLDELKQLRGERISRGFLAQAYANGWHDAIAAHRAPGWDEREAGWRKYLAEVEAHAVPQHPKPTGGAK